MQMRRLLPCLAVLTLATPSLAQEVKPEDDRTLNALVLARCPGADIVRVERSGSGLVEVEYLCNGELTEAGISEGKVLYEQREAKPGEQVMDRIRKKLAKDHPGWLLDEIDLVTTPDTAFLKAEVMREGVELNVFFTTDGKKYKPVALLASDQWTLNDLRTVELPQLGYDLLEPDSTYELPDLLREVSGIALADDHTVLCVQDELAAVFTYDLREERITRVMRFDDIGDFEDLLLNGDRILVLRSDGRVYELDHRSGKLRKEWNADLRSLNYEGIFQDPQTGAVCVVAKEPPVAGHVDERPAEQVDAEGHSSLWRNLGATEVEQAFARELPGLARRKVLFQPSAAAIHPITGALFVLSASDRLLVAYQAGKCTVTPLPAEVFFKPEGLAFFPNGDLLISSEGDKKGVAKGSMMRFGFRPAK